MSTFDHIAFDADDTLWHTERLYAETQKRFAHLLSNYHDPEWINERLYQIETRNIQHYGYGVKAFALSLIETAIKLTEGRISSRDIQEIVDWAKGMLSAEIELLPHVSQIIPQLSNQYSLMVVTKGDLLDQEAKIKKSGLGKYFQHIEIISEKTTDSYGKLLGKYYAIAPGRFIMIGNSLQSDILPVLELGGKAVHIPYEITWLHEAAEPPHNHVGYYQLANIGKLPRLLEHIAQNTVQPRQNVSQ